MNGWQSPSESPPNTRNFGARSEPDIFPTMTTQIDIKPIEIDGKFWIMVIMDGREINWRGPFADADVAETVAARLRRFSRALRAQVHT